MGVKVRSLSLSVLVIAIAVLVFGWWLISRPLPVISAPPIDEARDRPTAEAMMWSADFVRTFDEPRIDSVSPEANEVYRLTVLPSFRLPIIVRVEKSGERILLTVK